MEEGEREVSPHIGQNGLERGMWLSHVSSGTPPPKAPSWDAATPARPKGATVAHPSSWGCIPPPRPHPGPAAGNGGAGAGSAGCRRAAAPREVAGSPRARREMPPGRPSLPYAGPHSRPTRPPGALTAFMAEAMSS